MGTHGTARTQDRLRELVAEQEEIFVDRQPRSRALIERARASLAGGATSSWQIARPQMVWISHGEGSKVYDADGTEYIDLHNGYGVGAVGHAHPVVAEALRRRALRGTHFAQPVEDAIAVAEELGRRFGLPQWRFSNSGTEATMDAVHLMRAATGRDLIVKVEGGYHGHHDAVMVAVAHDPDDVVPPEQRSSRGLRGRYPPAGAGIPQAIADCVIIVPFNDLGAVEQALDEHQGEVAGMILEPIMMNAGIIAPDDGYLAGLRELTRRHDVLLAFDEVKTGLTTAAGGVTERSGVTPDIVCLAKALGGGVPCGAIGGTAEVMQVIATGAYEQVGTFNGNPLTMAAARATVTEVLDAAAYEHFEQLAKQARTGIEQLIDTYELAAYVLTFGAKGCVTFSADPVRTYREFFALDDLYSHCHWLFQHNGGVFLPPWGKSEQWTLSVQHTSEDVARFVDNFETFARALRA